MSSPFPGNRHRLLGSEIVGEESASLAQSKSFKSQKVSLSGFRDLLTDLPVSMSIAMFPPDKATGV